MPLNGRIRRDGFLSSSLFWMVNWMFLSFGLTVNLRVLVASALPLQLSLFHFDCAIDDEIALGLPRQARFGGGSRIHYYSGLS